MAQCVSDNIVMGYNNYTLNIAVAMAALTIAKAT